ncbi:MAG TPA: protein kinase, partial [Kofleriaceae bacterium]|nr:protein kinase [Kofleriaceae bacterium]
MPRDSDLETSVERADPLVGTIFDRRFRIEERIATGGFGAIYRATHVKSSHPVALKVLLPSLAQDLGVVARFRREGDTLTALRNPHTITAYELGQAADRTLFITMELLHGESLYERYKAQGPLEWKRMVRIARQICESLEEAHAMGIVHRDLKPTNIHLETKGGDVDFVKVLDFGIAKIIGGALDATDLTNAGQMVGTLDYMSPEQMVGGTVTGQTDIYTLGIVMYEMIAGATPFPEAMTAAQALAAVMKLEPDPLYLRVPVPEELDRIVQKCLARETERRYQTVAELRADLDRLLAGGAVDRGASFETKPVARQDDEATMFTPPPEPVLAASRRAKRPSGEETTFTPPPEPLLAASRRAADWSNEATTAGTPSAQLLAASRRAKRPSVEETSFTPPPEQVLADLRRAPRPRQDADQEWTDDDEHAATVRRRREASDTEQQSGEQDKVTAVARLADIVERAAMTRGPADARRDASERAVTVPRDA